MIIIIIYIKCTSNFKLKMENITVLKYNCTVKLIFDNYSSFSANYNTNMLLIFCSSNSNVVFQILKLLF